MMNNGTAINLDQIIFNSYNIYRLIKIKFDIQYCLTFISVPERKLRVPLISVH